MPQVLARFSRWAGVCLILAGVSFFVLGIMTPFLNLDDMRRDPLFVWRQTLAVLIGLLLLLGSVGVYLRQGSNPRLLTTLAFVAACIGSALLVALEWSELFLARDLATRYPNVLAELDSASGLTPFDWGTMLAAAGFAIGWIALSISTLVTGPFSRWPGLLIILGLFAVPAMTATLPMPYGPVIGSAVIACGFIWLGRDLARPKVAEGSRHLPGETPA